MENSKIKKLSQKIAEVLATLIGVVLTAGFITIVLALTIKAVQFILF